MMIEPTNICNLRCTFCALQMPGGHSAEKKKQYLDVATYKKIIDEVKDSLIFLFLYLGGEPFLHKNIFDLIKYASDRGISVVIATNGSFNHIQDFGKRIVYSGLDVLIFSVSGTSQDYYGNLHVGGDLQKVCRNIREVTAYKSGQRPRTIFRYIATPKNKNDRGNIKEFVKGLRVDTHEIRNVDGELVLADNLSDAAEKQKRKKRRGCFWLWCTLVMKSSGDVVPCCYDYYGIPVLGNINHSSLGEIWNGTVIKQIREAWIKYPEKLEFCAQCDFSTGFQDNASKEKDKIVVKKAKQEKENSRI
ncbi:MAG: radical SAM protein [Thermodesulfobacteriota bacterium]|nr:radical SAM protein [Thermodesulfobacteriota bacterium]